MKIKLIDELKKINETKIYAIGLMSDVPRTYAISGISEDSLKELASRLGEISPPIINETFAYKENEEVLCIKYFEDDDVVAWLKTFNYTVDATALDLKTAAVIDPFNGTNDYRNKVLKLIAKDKDLNDPLLILDVVQRSVETNFALHSRTKYLIKTNKRELLNVPSIDIGKKLRFIVKTPKAKKFFDFCHSYDILAFIMPRLYKADKVKQTMKAGIETVRAHCLLSMEAVPPHNELVRWAALYHDLGKTATRKTVEGRVRFFGHEKVSASWAYKDLVDWGFGREFAKDVSLLCLHHMFDAGPQLTDEAVRRLIRRVGKRQIYNLLTLREADSAGFVGKPTGKWKITKLRNRIDEQIQKNPFSIAGLAISKKEIEKITQMSYPRTIDLISELLLNMVLFKDLKNSEVALIDWLQNINWQDLENFCPIGLGWFLEQHIARIEGRADENINGTLKCGMHCKFKCDAQEKDLWIQ